jgi:hypothetical protein
VLNFCSVTNRLLPSLLLIATIPAAFGQTMARPSVPDTIAAPAGSDVMLVAHASGSQIYICQAGSDGKYSWVLKAPEADLYDQKGAIIGHHFAGPTWKAGDGSEVLGQAKAKVNSPDPSSIPWLLVIATGHSGDGVFSHVSSIQRINTKGGQPPPAGVCNAGQQNVEIKSTYSADYYFYSSEPHGT